MANSSLVKMMRSFNQQQARLQLSHWTSQITNRTSNFSTYTANKMPSSKGKPTDPELREEIKEGESDEEPRYLRAPD